MGEILRGPDQMLVKHSQRYQKNRFLSCVGVAGLKGLGCWMLLSLALAGCAGAQSADDDVSSAPVPASETASGPVTPADAPEGATARGETVPAVPVLTLNRSLIASPAVEQAVIDAREAMQKKQWSRLATLVPVAQQDPLLGSYAQYWLLRQRVQDPTVPVPTAELQQFMATNQDDYLADRVKADWIVAAARAQDYALVNQLGPVVSSNANVDCSRLMAAHMTGQKVTAEQAMQAFKPASMCWSMLDEFAERGIVNWKALQTELRATLETSKTGNARRLAALMFNGGEMKSYAALMKNPRQWLKTQGAPSTQAQRELVALALSRMAREKDRPAAAAYIDSTWAGKLPKADMEWVWGQFGLVSALNVEPEAVQWYRRSGNHPKTDYNHAWEVRSELRQAPIDWKLVEQTVLKMSPEQQAEPVWVYWRGRALAAMGQHEAARIHFASIRNDYGFYGLLAVEELGEPMALPPTPTPVTAEELAQARSNIDLLRAIKLFDLGWRPEAVPEWNFALRGMNDRQLRAAAELARQEQIYDRVVNTSLRTKNEIDFSQRFIAPFEGRVAAKAREIDLDPAWVYGLIRQESRFITDARSRVGASGLMQLMPATARWVAKKIGMSNFTPSSVNDFDTNTILGTNYLDMVLQRLNGSEVLATAGYNAGPGRSVQWRSRLEGPVEGAIFAETIPFTETRLYVKHVLSNAVYYDMMFTGNPRSIKSRLGRISPEPTTRVALP